MSETTERRVFKVPADGHGALFVEADDEEEAFEIARDKGSVGEANMSLSIGESYRERVKEVEDPRYPPINAESPADNTLTGSVQNSIPSFPTVGELRAARRRLDLTQKDVADAMGVSPKTVSHYEQGTREITLSKARDYADVLRGAL